MTTQFSTFDASYKEKKFTRTEQIKKNKAISAVYAKREYLLRELKETNSLLHQLMSQIDLNEQYKKLQQM